MVILPLVEGHGEVAAAPVLIRRLCHELGRFDINVRNGYRVNRDELAEPEKLSLTLRAAREQHDPDVMLVIFDADDDCPKDLAALLQPICNAFLTPTLLVVANREFEAWFLGAIQSLKDCRGMKAELEPVADPESPRGAKEKLSLQMNEPYAPTLHQTRFSAIMNLSEASANCRSFRRLQSVIAKLLSNSD